MGSQSQKTTNRPTPEVLGLFNQVKGQYSNADGTIKSSPTVDPTSAASQARADQLVAGLSNDTYAAHQGVRDSVGAWRPGMDQARSYIQNSANPTGQKIDFQGGGWSTGSDGRAVFSHDDAYDKSYNQYTDQVVGNTLGRLRDTYDQQHLRDTDAAVKAGSFGGSRQAVRGALTNEMHQRAAAEAAASGYSNAHQSALQQIAALYGMGSSAVGANNQVDDANSARQLRAGGALSAQEQQEAQLRAGDVNAQAAVGAQLENQDQSRRNAVLEESNRQFYDPLQIATTMAGMMPNTGSSTSSTSGGTGSLIAGAALKALPMLMTSDERAKEDIKKSNPNDALKELRQLVPQTYSYKDDAKALGAPAGERTGFMAQDVERATGREAPMTEGGYKGVDIAEHLGRLTHALIALDRKVGKKAA